jgi:integrase
MATPKCKRFNFTQTSLDALPVPERRTWVYDTKSPQLGLTLLSTGTRSFHVRATVYGQTKRIGLENGKYPGMKVEQARKEATRLLAEIADKADPVESRKEKKASEVTLRDVFNDYFLKKRGRKGDKLRESTKSEYEMALDKTVDDYWDRPLSDIDESLVLRRYRKRMDESKTRAASFHKVITALFNFARVNYKRSIGTHSSGETYFPNNPGQVIVDHKLQYKAPRRKSYIREEEITDWFDAVESLGTIEREFLLFVLMAGVRKTEALTLTWDALDLRVGTFTLRDTKNREDVELPIPFYLQPMLKKRMGEGRVFPVGDDAKACLGKVRKGAGVHFTLHDLRRTYATTAEDLDISGLTVKRLLNHKTDSDVTAGYQIPNLKRLRSVSDRVVREMLKRSGRLNADVVELRA